jgi:predicted DNA-binding protein YlxM (UPF0122 family)
LTAIKSFAIIRLRYAYPSLQKYLLGLRGIMDENSVFASIEKTLRVNALLDFYGGLLTEKQRLSLALFYGDDFSLGEIAANVGISRQAVFDMLRRGEILLENYEKVLGLAREHEKRRKLFAEAEELALVLEENPSHDLWRQYWNKWRVLKEAE